VPGRFKDYISTPKPNGYRSLHTGGIGPERQRIEVQIRTREMHEVAELGVAAHWAYKANGRSDGKQYRWLRELLEIVEHAQNPEEFLEHTKLEMFQDQVFCFTPKGDLIALPRGATPVDFAYAVHSQVGDHLRRRQGQRPHRCRCARPGNGDQVEIITSKAQTPSPAWERFVVTGKARARIRRYVRSQQRKEYATLGKAMLQKAFRQDGHDFGEKALLAALKTLHAETLEDLYAESAPATGRATAVVLFPPEKHTPTATRRSTPRRRSCRSRPRPSSRARRPLPIRGLIPGMAVHYAGCCHPLPGDRIVGIVTTGKGVTVHTIDCETLESFSETPERWLDIAWGDDAETTEHVGRLFVTIANEPGSLGTLSTVIGATAATSSTCGSPAGRSISGTC
jgi:guanosine-3',5'-bis(diphosphate) 3'-pyrophosphohydrolase